MNPVLHDVGMGVFLAVATLFYLGMIALALNPGDDE